ncbi:MAG TPA: heme-copper oxidase subunit III [Polyangia bacterium]|jgi:heme/copper-type cytochrome/quinol oxidase subunit 3|nr:heme-copper oxidase subunit III [Polyangia bacterium]
MVGPAGDGATLTRRGAFGMWIFLGTDAAGFGGLLLADGVLRARASVWPDPRQRFSLGWAAAMTFVLLASSLTMSLAADSARRRQRGLALAWLAATIVAGAAFLGCQAFEYQHLLTGTPAVGLTSDLAASLFFVITGFHGAHVLAGIVYLIAVTIAQARATTASEPLLAVAALFWHFIDFVWAAIFFALYLLPVN